MQAKLLRSMFCSEVQNLSTVEAGKTLGLRDGFIQLLSAIEFISRLVGRRIFWADFSDISTAYTCAWSKLRKRGEPEQFPRLESCMPAGHLAQDNDELVLLASPFRPIEKLDNKSGLS